MRSRRGLLGLAALAGLSWAALLTGPGQAGEKQNPAATPSPRMGKNKQPDQGWMKRHEGFVAIARKGDVNVLFLGDSITDAWRSGGKKVWDKHFGTLKAANFGIGGDRTEHVLWRISNGEMEGIKPKVAVLMIGTNNVGGNSADQIASGIKAIVQKLGELSPDTKVLLLAVFPRGEKLEGNKARVKIDEINKQISKLDDGKRVRYLDIGGKFLKDDGSLTKDIMPDFLHLSGRGYEIWAQAITPTLREMMGTKE